MFRDLLSGRLRVVVHSGLLLLPASTFADTVHLKDGGVVKDCRVLPDDPGGKERGNLLLVRTPGGKMGIPRNQIDRVERLGSIFDTYDQKLAKIRDHDERGLFALARWCQETAGLREEMAGLLKKVIVLNPDHVEARHLLGYIRSGKEWKRLQPLTLAPRILGESSRKDLEQAVHGQLTVALMTREDVRLGRKTRDSNPDDVLELETEIATRKLPPVIFYGLEIRGPAMLATVSLKPRGKWLEGKSPPSTALNGEIVSSAPGAEAQAVIDGFTRNNFTLHRFLDQVVQLRVQHAEAAAADKDEGPVPADGPPGGGRPGE